MKKTNKEVKGARMMLKRTVLIMAAVWIMVLSVGVVMVQAGSLEPPAAPAPTMKTLDQIPPTWSEKITTGRFVDALGGAAVLDKETGLVWEKLPSTTYILTWAKAIDYCAPSNVGGRRGWHLPTIEQLVSLIDLTQTNPSLPTGHPFTNLKWTVVYWSATTSAVYTTSAWYAAFNNGAVTYADKAYGAYAWCVRGGQSHDAY